MKLVKQNYQMFTEINQVVFTSRQGLSKH